MLSGQESVSFIYKYALKEKNIMSLTSINVNNTLVTRVDSEPTAGSNNLVKSNGVANAFSNLDKYNSFGACILKNKSKAIKVPLLSSPKLSVYSDLLATKIKSVDDVLVASPLYIFKNPLVISPPVDTG